MKINLKKLFGVAKRARDQYQALKNVDVEGLDLACQMLESLSFSEPIEEMERLRAIEAVQGAKMAIESL